MINKVDVLNVLRPIQDPDLGKSIVDLGFVTNVTINGSSVEVELTLTTPACPVKDDFKRQAEELILTLNGVENASCQFSSKTPANQQRPVTPGKQKLAGVDRIIAIGSGKGGVGKSTIAVNIACALSQMGARVGLLDGDIYGPSIPLLMQADQEPRSEGNRMIPGMAHGIPIISMGFMAQGDEPLIWRGPMAHKAISQCLFDVDWGQLDYLLVDLPPGTGDIHLTLSQTVDLDGIAIVSTPQDLGLTISRKTLQMFRKTQVPILGIMENMSAFNCSNCGSEEHLFGKDIVRKSAEELNIPFLGEIPFDLTISQTTQGQKPVVLRNPKAPASLAITRVTQQLVRELSIINNKQQIEV